MDVQLKKGVAHLKRNDPILLRIIKDHGECTLIPSKTYFQNIVRSIISQQLSVKAAATIYKRFLQNLKGKITPAAISKLKPEEFRSAGVSGQKMRYLIDLSNFCLKNNRFFSNLENHSNQEIITELTKIKGIGEWTAQMFLIFSLNRLNVLPKADIGVKNSIKIHYNFKNHPDSKSIDKIALNWGEYSSIAAWYLWRALDNRKKP